MLHKEVFDSTTNKYSLVVEENQLCCGTYVTLSRSLQVIDGTEEWEKCGYKNSSVTCIWKSDSMNAAVHRLIGCDYNVLI